MLIHRVALKNLLSFGPDGIDLPLKPLNVLIGPNGSGKSNLIEAMSLIQAAPRELAKPIREGGGIVDWLWKGEPNAIASVDIVVHFGKRTQTLGHSITLQALSQRFELAGERIYNANPRSLNYKNVFFYQFKDKHTTVRDVNGEERSIYPEDFDSQQSVLSQLKDPDLLPEITFLGNEYDRIRIYRDWSFGRNTLTRQPQKADQRNDFLEEDCRNLGMVLNRLRKDLSLRAKLLDLLKQLYPAVEDFDVSIEGGSVQVFFHEGNFTIPATRLSDGTLRFLCLIVLLCDPDPGPLICIEEPELGLHPDVLPCLGELLKEASTRTQLIVTTHSDVLVDSLQPEDIVVCEKHEGQSVMQRLDSEKLKVWLKDYSLGQLWTRGELGGNRW